MNEKDKSNNILEQYFYSQRKILQVRENQRPVSHKMQNNQDNSFFKNICICIY